MYKNQLQEYFHKNKCEFSDYSTILLDGPDHLPTFQSTMFVKFSEYDSKNYVATGNSKKESEMNVAKKIMENIHLKKSNNKISLNSYQKIVLLFDIENLLVEFIQFIENYQINENICVMGFISEKHHMYEKIKEKCFNSFVILKNINLMMKNTMDCYIQITLGSIMGEKDYTDAMVIIMTKDKFGELIEKVCEHINDSYVFSVKSFSSLNSMVNYVNDP